MESKDIGGARPGLKPDLQRLKDIELLADWRDELQAKLRRAELQWEYIGIDVGLEGLCDEIAAFNQVVAGLGEQQRRDAPDHDDRTQPLKLIRGGRNEPPRPN